MRYRARTLGRPAPPGESHNVIRHPRALRVRLLIAVLLTAAFGILAGHSAPAAAVAGISGAQPAASGGAVADILPPCFGASFSVA